MEVKYIITANYKGRRIRRTVYGEYQAWCTVNTLRREGCTDIGMREEDE